MVRAAISFFILALVAYALGARGIAGISMEIGNVLLIFFLVLTVISVVAAMVSGRSQKNFGLFVFLVLTLVVGAGLSSKAAETNREKLETSASKASDQAKKSYRNMKDETCETMNGKVECYGKKMKHRAQNTSDSMKTNSKELKNKFDNK